MCALKKNVKVLFFMERLPSGGLEKSLHAACWFSNALSHCSKQQLSNVDCLGSCLRKPTDPIKTSKKIQNKKLLLYLVLGFGRRASM